MHINFAINTRYYLDVVEKLGDFLNSFPPFPTSFLVGGPADMFVIELTDQVTTSLVGQHLLHLETPLNHIVTYFHVQLQKLKVEPVLLHYLSQIKVLQGDISSMRSLRSCSMPVFCVQFKFHSFGKPDRSYCPRFGAQDDY